MNNDSRMSTAGGSSGDEEEEQESEEVLGQVVKDAHLYSTMKTPGALQPSHLFPPFSGELVLLMLPDAMNPLELINSEVVVGGHKESLVVAGGQKYRLATHKTSTDMTNSLPCLFLPDRDGQLTKVPSDIKACVVVKGDVEERAGNSKGCVNIEALRSVHYKVPKEVLHRRDFFAKTKTREMATMETQKPVKRKKNAASLPNRLDGLLLQSNGEVQSPGKKKKNKHVTSNSKEVSEHSLHTEELDFYMKNIKKEHLEHDAEYLSLSPYKEKKKKKDKANVRT